MLFFRLRKKITITISYPCRISIYPDFKFLIILALVIDLCSIELYIYSYILKEEVITMFLKKYLSILILIFIVFFIVSCGDSNSSTDISKDFVYIPFDSYLENLNTNTDDMILAAGESSFSTMPDLYDFVISNGFGHIQDYIDIYINFKLYATFNSENSTWEATINDPTDTASNLTLTGKTKGNEFHIYNSTETDGLNCHFYNDGYFSIYTISDPNYPNFKSEIYKDVDFLYGFFMAQINENDIGIVTFKIDPEDNFFTAEGYFYITNLSNYSDYDFLHDLTVSPSDWFDNPDSGLSEYMSFDYSSGIFSITTNF